MMYVWFHAAYASLLLPLRKTRQIGTKKRHEIAISKDNVVFEDVEIFTIRFSEDDGRRPSGGPPRAVVDRVISNYDAIAIVDADARSGARMNNHIRNFNVLAV